MLDVIACALIVTVGSTIPILYYAEMIQTLPFGNVQIVGDASCICYQVSTICLFGVMDLDSAKYKFKIEFKYE